MIRSKLAILSSFIILAICMYLSFPFPNNVTLGAHSTFMSFPISDLNGYIWLGVVGTVLFIVALILLIVGIKKYYFRTIVAVLIIYSILPTFLISLYQETFANGIQSISYDGNGNCNFEDVSEDIINGECNLVLHNHSNEAVTFELEFLDSFPTEDELQVESLMNIAGPYRITIEANQKKSIHLKKLLDLSDTPKHIDSGSSKNIHFKLIDGETTRIL